MNEIQVKKKALLSWLLLSLLIFIGCSSANKKLIQVPDLRGLSLEDAKQIAKASGLKVFVSVHGYFPSVKKGFVITQTPFPNTKVKKDRTIALQVSEGPAKVEMPSLFGMNYGKASEMIMSLNLYVEKVIEDSESKDSNGKEIKDIFLGFVKGQTPSPGSVIVAGSGVTLTVYKPGLGIVPNLIDITLDDARSMVISSGYLVGSILFKESRSHARGVVTIQEPIPGSPAEAGSLINLTVNEKP